MNSLINLDRDRLRISLDNSFIHRNSSILNNVNKNLDALVNFPLKTGSLAPSLNASTQDTSDLLKILALGGSTQDTADLLKILAPLGGSNQTLASLKLSELIRPPHYLGILPSCRSMILAQKSRELTLKTAAAEHAVNALLLKNKDIPQNSGNFRSNGNDLKLSPPTVKIASNIPNSNVSSSLFGVVLKKDSNDETLETLGTICLDRRKNRAPYFDASSLKDPDPISVASSRLRGGVGERFPEKLYRMLMEAQSEGKEDVISFCSHGRAFCIHKPKKFSKEIMPKYFRQSRVSSFQRQLNIYGFARINTGPDAGGYYHELFLRGRPALSVHIRRVGVPQAIPRRRGVKAHDATQDPDFYSIPPIAEDKRELKGAVSSTSRAT